MTIEIPEYALTVLERLRKNGYEAWAVGGCVRDSLLGRKPQDWDIATSALPEETERCFSGFRIIETGITHGTVTILSAGIPVEVTTFRVDGSYSDSRHPDSVSFTRSLHEDLARRDFTVNAMAYSKTAGLRDDFGGREDLAAKKIRCVGNPRQRFEEDALRILRSLRFASVLEFSLEEQTADAVLALCDSLTQIAAERIFTEWNKLLCGAGAKPVLLSYSPVFAVFLPELRPLLKAPDLWRAAVERVCAAPAEKSLRTALLFRALPGKTAPEQSLLARKTLRALRAESKLIARMCALVETTMPEPVALPEIRRMLGRSGQELFDSRLALLRAEKFSGAETAVQFRNEILARGDCISLSQLAVSGRDFPGAGKLTGALLDAALEAVLCDRTPNTREALLEYLRRNPLSETKQ